MPEKDIKMVVLRHLSELQENRDESTKPGKQTKRKCPQRNKNYKTRQTESLELKNTETKRKNAIEVQQHRR